MKGLEGDFEVNDVVSGGLDRVVIEDCVLGCLVGLLVVVVINSYNSEDSDLISHSLSVDEIVSRTPILGYLAPVLSLIHI